ncbi:hypothetical protein DFP72DRAFT_956637 [Ephemerocybe angulata]|uniref:ML-like domain-containing protein n=1 Tax=Ephemerocybe angulata TaxID=980116 RepID=A0A8H6MBL0_9AGAR|nr:hypothetical protein DFP72DRAFT_956637 [Tulosesus angulatus]
MFSSLAWLRAFAFALLVLSPSTSAREETIFTSSVTYCNPPETLLISRFEVAYFPQNSSVAFNVSAASVQPNVSVTANLFVNVYGMKPLNLTLDLCNILGGALCPLPMYNFTGADSLSLPDSLGINGRIPSIAFSIPDLEGFAQLTLTEVGTGNIKACVQATLANGWSAHQEAVEWTTGGLAIFAFLAALLVSFLSKDAQNVTPFRFVDLISLFQAIASSALLSLNYPSVYRAFALNFAWALGLFPTREDGAIQSSINKMRHRTGGRLADAAQGSAVQFVNRKLSPYNDNLLAIGGLASISTTNSDLLTRQLEPAQQMVPNLARRFVNLVQREGTVTGEVKTVTNSSANVLQAGLPIYVNSLHVATGNAFMTVFLVALMMFAIGLAILALGYGVYVLVRRRRRTTKEGFIYLAFSRSWILRLSLIALFPLLIFIFNQWTLKDSWASILLSVLTLVALTLLIGYPSFTTLRLARTRSPFELYTPAHPHLQAAGPLYAQYRVPRYYFYFCAPLVGTVLRAVFIAFAQSNDTAQIALMVALEVCLVAVHLVLRPHPSRGGDVFSTFVAVVRMLVAGLSIAFLQGLDVKPIPRVVIGFVMVVVFGVAVIVVVVNFFVNLVAVCLPRKGGKWGEG